MDALAIPVSQEEINLFHSIDRRLYSIMALELWVDPFLALKVMAFWICLERLGFKNTVSRILSLPTAVVSQLVQEAITCVHHLRTTESQSGSDVAIPVTQGIISERLCLQYFAEKRLEILGHFSEVTLHVCRRALMDICREAQERNDAWLRDQRSSVHPDNRTMFVTFSRGYPVAEQEVKEFLTGYYGDCIESVYMQEPKPGEQSLYARVVFYRGSTIEEILSGNEKVMHAINGKHVCMRKFVPKNKKKSRE